MKRTTAAFLAFFLGGIGMHKFYLGQPIVGLLYLVCCMTFIPAIIGLLESMMLFGMSDADFEKKYGLKT